MVKPLNVSMLDLPAMIEQNQQRQAQAEKDRLSRIEADQRARLVRMFTPKDLLEKQKRGAL